MLAITLHFTGTSFRAAILTSRNTSCCFSPCHDPAHSQNNSRMTKLCKASLMQLQNITVPYLIALVKRDTCHTIHGQKIYPYHVVYCSRCFATQQTTHKSIVTIPVFITPRLNQLPLTGELVYHWTQFTNACGARVRKRAEKGTAVTLTWCSHLDKMDFEGFLEAYDAIPGQGLSNKLQTTNVIQSNRYKVQYISLNVSIT